MDINEIKKNLQTEFNNRRMSAELLATKNLEVANSYPAFVNITKLEKDLIFKIGKAKFEGTDTKAYEKDLKTIRTQKAKFLKRLGLDEDDLKPKYQCPNCHDSGYVGTMVCECFEKALSRRIIQESGYDFDRSITFDQFDSSICKNEKQKHELELLKTKLLDWCNKYPNVKKFNITLAGTTGCGKTFAANCIASEFEKKGYIVCFLTAFQMNEVFLKYHTTFNNFKNSILTPLTSSDLLIIDDLGTEPMINNVTVNYLYNLVSERARFSKPTIFTTNIISDKNNGIMDRYGERIYSRIANKDNAILLVLEGDDLRIKKNPSNACK